MYLYAFRDKLPIYRLFNRLVKNYPQIFLKPVDKSTKKMNKQRKLLI